MRPIQRIIEWFYRNFICWHSWKNLKHYGLPMEPYFVECVKCGVIRKSVHSDMFREKKE